jgi:hypothetical protein
MYKYPRFLGTRRAVVHADHDVSLQVISGLSKLGISSSNRTSRVEATSLLPETCVRQGLARTCRDLQGLQAS